MPRKAILEHGPNGLVSSDSHHRRICAGYLGACARWFTAPEGGLCERTPRMSGGVYAQWESDCYRFQPDRVPARNVSTSGSASAGGVQAERLFVTCRARRLYPRFRAGYGPVPAGRKNGEVPASPYGGSAHRGSGSPRRWKARRVGSRLRPVRLHRDDANFEQFNQPASSFALAHRLPRTGHSAGPPYPNRSASQRLLIISTTPRASEAPSAFPSRTKRSFGRHIVARRGGAAAMRLA